MKSLRGIFPIVAAVYNDQGAVDLVGFQKLVRHLIQTGVNGLTLFGIVTEFYKLTDEEQEAMMRLFLKETKESPIAGIVSITQHSWEVAVQRARSAEELGADALMLFPPYFLSPPVEAILHHAKKVAQSVTIPVIVQYAPNQSGVKITPDTFVKLQQECPNAKYVKVETQPPGRYASELHVQSNGQIETFIGYAGIQMPDVLERGCAGIQPGCSFSETYVELFRLFQAGEHEEMNRLFQRLLPYITYWMQGIELIIKADKEILKYRGLIESSYCRHPNYGLDKLEMKMIDSFMKEFDVYLK